MGVCLVGQLGRLELTSKLKHIFEANPETYFHFFMIVTTTEVLYVNGKPTGTELIDWSQKLVEVMVKRHKNVEFKFIPM